MPRILLDDAGHAGGSDQLFLGTTVNDNTGDTLHAGGAKLKQWAADLNTMLAELYGVSSVTATLIASQNDYSPGGYVAGTTNRLRLTAASGGSTVTGIAAPGDNWRVLITNDSATDSITFTHQDSGSVSANRFKLSNADVVTLAPLACAWVVYVVDSWRFA